MSPLAAASPGVWILVALLSFALVVATVAWWRARRKSPGDTEPTLDEVLASLIEGVIIFKPVQDGSSAPVDFIYEQITPEAARVLGDTVEAIRGDRLLRRFPSVLHTGDWKRLNDVWNGAGPSQYEISYRADGLDRDFVYRVWRLRDRLLVAVEDLTRLRGAERRMQESEGLFQAIFRSAPIALALADPSSKDQIAPIVECNEMFARNHGYTREDLIGKSIGVVQLDPYTPETLAARVQSLRESNGLVDRRLSRRKDGSLRDLLVHARLLNVGGRELILGANVDMTEQYLAVAARREAEDMLRIVFDAVPLMLGLVEFLGDDVRFLQVNTCYAQWWGRPTHEIEGQLASSIQLNRDSLDQQLEHFGACIAEGRIRMYEHQANGRVFSGRVAPLPGDEARPPRVCFCIEDITDRRRAERELALGRKLLSVGEMAAGMAHEMNNQLTPALLSIDMVSHSKSLEESDREALVMVRQALQRTIDLNRRVLGFGRRTETRSGVCLLEDAVRAATELMAPTFNRRILVETRNEAPREAVVADRDEVIQIIVNLMINARDTVLERLAAEAPTWVPRIEVITGVVEPGAQRLTVRDNGMGIPEAVRERLFEPFFTTKGPDRGNGLGLATIWHAVERAGGRIEFETRHPGGTSFHVHFRQA